MRSQINTENFENIKSISLFVFAIGFEERSRFIFSKLEGKKLLSNQNTLCFYFNENRNDTSILNFEKVTEFGITPIDVWKSEIDKIIGIINAKVLELIENSENIEIHVDYSSMPRNWYSNILLDIEKMIRNLDNVFFWYSHGDYTADTKHCTTAGADDFVVFSGMASLHPQNRTHIFGIGYDKIKSDAIRTVVDPSTLIVCYTYPKNELSINQIIQKEHEMLLNASAYSFSLPIEDFSFIVKRIREVVLEFRERGDVILIPEGPKPLILACSIIPELITKRGIVCFHVKSHNNHFVPENIKPNGIISGFCIKPTSNE